MEINIDMMQKTFVTCHLRKEHTEAWRVARCRKNWRCFSWVTDLKAKQVLTLRVGI